MCQVYKIASNPDSLRFYLNHSYLYPYGNCPAIDLTGGCQTKHDVDFLLLGCGDIRNILFTLKTLSDEKSMPKNLHFYLNDFEGVILARNLVLLRILEIIDPDRDEDVEFLWSVWYDAAIRQESLNRLTHIIQDLLQNVPTMVEYMTEETEEEVKRVLKYWLEGNLTLDDVKVKRFEVLHERLELSKMREQQIIPPYIYEEGQVRTWREEVVNFVDTGSTYKEGNLKGSGDFGANPTLLCPRVAGWRVHPDGTPFHSYNLHGLTEGQSLFYNCLSQLKTMVLAWKRLRTRKGSKIKMSLWLEHCLTLCNNISTSDRKFDFIHTSNIADHLGLLNLLVACSGLLNRSGILTMDIMHWIEMYYSMEDYLNDQIRVPSSYFPTVFNLRMAEDFEMGTSTPRSLIGHIFSTNVTVRWLDAGKAAERIDINDSPELLTVFRGLVQACMPLDLQSLRKSPMIPSLLVHIVRKMKDNIVGGAKTLLDIIIKSQPGLKTKSGHVFYPHENCFRAIWLTYRDQLGCDWPGDQDEHGLLMLEIHTRPNRAVAFSKERVQIGTVIGNFGDYLLIPQRVFPPNEPWFFVTTIAYDMTGRIKLLLPSDVWDSLGHSSILELHGTSVREDQLFSMIAIKEHPAVKTVGRLFIASKAVNWEEKTNHLKVTEYIDKYEIHMNWHESLGEFPYLKVKRCLDPTELLIESKSSSSTCRLRCPVLDVQAIPSLSEHSYKITAKKDLDALNGPLILKHRRLDIQSYPMERKSTWQFDRILNTNFAHEECKRMGIEANDPLFNVTKYVLMFLKDTKIKPPEKPLEIYVNYKQSDSAVTVDLIAPKEKDVQPSGIFWPTYMVWNMSEFGFHSVLGKPVDLDFTLTLQHIHNLRGSFIFVKERNPDQSIGYVSGDMFICIHECHLVNEILTVDIDWIDFEKVNLYIKKGKVPKREVSAYCEAHGGHPSTVECVLEVTHKEALLLRKWLILNTMKSKQRQIDQRYQWLFNSFLQPVYTINNKIVDKEQMKDFADSTRDSKSPRQCSWCTKEAPDLKNCKRCRTVLYCGTECQKKDWPRHRLSCTTNTMLSSSPNEKLEKPEKVCSTSPEKVCSSCSRPAPVLRDCARCRSAMYCGKECQTKDWPNHRHSCKSTTNTTLSSSPIEKLEKPEKVCSTSPEKVCSSCSRPAPVLRACTRCLSAVYCGKECQTRDWPNHRQSCKCTREKQPSAWVWYH